MLPKLAGRYLAVPTSWEVGEYNGSPVVEFIFNLLQFADVQGWEPLPTGMTITKRFFLKKNDGSWSDHAINSLMESLHWDGASLKSLAGGDYSQTEVQLEIDYETSKKDNKSYIGVKFMNPRDYQGQHLASDPAIVQRLDAKYGAELRARAKSAPKPATKSAAGPVDHKAGAWKEFISKTPDLTTEARADEWRRTVKGYAGVEVKEVKDWQNVANMIAEHGVWKDATASSVSAGPGIPEDEIPF